MTENYLGLRQALHKVEAKQWESSVIVVSNLSVRYLPRPPSAAIVATNFVVAVSIQACCPQLQRPRPSIKPTTSSKIALCTIRHRPNFPAIKISKILLYRDPQSQVPLTLSRYTTLTNSRLRMRPFRTTFSRLIHPRSPSRPSFRSNHCKSNSNLLAAKESTSRYD